MKTFEIGKEYTHGWIGDSNLFTIWKVTSRTALTVTITNGSETKTCRIIKGLSEIRKSESIYPYGKYSMCPILSA